MTVIDRLDLRTMAVAVFIPLSAVAIGAELVHRHSLIRLLIFALVVCALFVVSTTDPRNAIVLLFVLLPFLGLSRRLLISTAGWATHDPLVLLGPAIATLLVVRLFVLERRPLTGDRLSQVVLALLFLALLESVNPHGGSVSAGVAGFLYVGVPIFWYFIGRELVDEQTVRRILLLVVVLGVPIALYGLVQLINGFPSWDAAWIRTSGYGALIVGVSARSFGTFPSAAEYATYLAMGVVVAVAFALRGRSARTVTGLAAAPLLAAAMFLDSSRGVVVVTALGAFAVYGLSRGSTRALVAAVAVGGLAAGLAIHTYAGALQATGQGYVGTKLELVTHQVNGLTHPLNSSQSTLLIHYHSVLGGLRTAVHNPIGEGTAPISKGGTALGAVSGGTEFDLSDAFVGLGLAGGCLFLLLLFRVARVAVRVYLRSRSNTVLAAFGVLVVSFGGWLNGALYTITPLVWLLIGWLAQLERQAPGEELTP